MFEYFTKWVTWREFNLIFNDNIWDIRLVRTAAEAV